jgi:three-Cys-motif partner protein
MPKADLSAYAGREQAYVKHYLLEKYLAPLAYKVGSAWDSFVYIDGFSGPWQTTRPDYADSSFGVAVDTLRQVRDRLQEMRGRNLPIHIILVEQDKKAFAALQKFATESSTPGFTIHPICGEFVPSIPEINQVVRKHAKNPFRFVFLDPKGWSDIPMKALQAFLRDRSCEVLINLMTRHIIRFLDQPDREESYKNLFGRADVLEKLRAATRDERTDQAVREYCRSLRQLCDFSYVSSAVILDPTQESIRYFLVYGTNHPRGIEVFKEAEMTATRTQDFVRHETHVRKSGQPELIFGDHSPGSRVSDQLRRRYLERARTKIVDMLRHSTAGEIRYSELFCEAMAFPLVTPADLRSWIEALVPNVRLRLAGSTRRKKPSPEQDDRVTVVNRSRLR